MLSWDPNDWIELGISDSFLRKNFYFLSPFKALLFNSMRENLKNSKLKNERKR